MFVYRHLCMYMGMHICIEDLEILEMCKFQKYRNSGHMEFW